MNEDIRQSEAWVIRQAERLSPLLRADQKAAGMPDYLFSVDALAVLLAGTWRLPCYRELAERVQREHRNAKHAGLRTDQCEACGWFDGAAYAAVTGREFVDDFPELFNQRTDNPSRRLANVRSARPV